MTAGRLLREARRRAGLTQMRLADRSGVAQSLITRYETGRVEPTLRQLERLVAACGLTLQLGLDATDPAMRAQIEDFRRLSVEDRLRSVMNTAAWRAATRPSSRRRSSRRLDA